MDGLLGVQNGLSELGGILLRQGQYIKSQSLGGLGAHAGQAGKLLYQFFKGGGEVLHGRNLRTV